MTYAHIEEFKVRDYECDLQGIVNNAVYQNYLEHARHEFLLSKGVDFAALAAQGLNLVVVRAELDYRRPLKSGDAFYVATHFAMQDRVRFQFQQVIHRRADDVICLNALIVGTGMTNSGRPRVPKDLVALLGQ
ncbi:acyl-CoA thioesterase [Reinekea sp.]|jgi:acyl-CoA thioester hydrolase|uniref:acyl-CoA thioesterase n=1 Tax=Reinekea sp. TaxID=1970455 RepID=UPI002A8159A2|nr:acyl-CoA thioesterase [Reinekea sp.]